MTDKDFSDNLQLVLEVASKKIIRELPYSFDFLDFCSINWQEHEINTKMFNRFLNSHITDIVHSLHSVARTNVNFFKCWYAQFGKAIADLKIRIETGITDGAFYSTSIYISYYLTNQQLNPMSGCIHLMSHGLILQKHGFYKCGIVSDFIYLLFLQDISTMDAVLVIIKRSPKECPSKDVKKIRQIISTNNINT